MGAPSRARWSSGRLKLSPRARPLGAFFRIDELAAEVLAELHGVLALGEAEDVHVGAVLIEGMPLRAERRGSRRRDEWSHSCRRCSGTRGALGYDRPRLAGWTLPDNLRRWSMQLSPSHATTIDLEVEKFRNYWHGQQGARSYKSDWRATWRSWWHKSTEARKSGSTP